MKKPAWKKRITEACEQAGTYREFFDPVIDTLASILEKRDQANELFLESGGKVVVKHTNKSGATNIEQNPVLRLMNDLNRDALAYWRDLGLTPAGLKKLNADVVQEKNADGLEKILARLVND